MLCTWSVQSELNLASEDIHAYCFLRHKSALRRNVFPPLLKQISKTTLQQLKNEVKKIRPFASVEQTKCNILCEEPFVLNFESFSLISVPDTNHGNKTWEPINMLSGVSSRKRYDCKRNWLVRLPYFSWF